MSKRSARASTAQSSKRARTATGQTTLFRYCDTTSGASSGTQTKPHVTQERPDIKIYTKEEIEDASGMKKIYLQFWNDKANELWKDKEVREKMKDNKRAFMGAINVSWTIHRTEVIHLQVEEVIELAGQVYPSEATKEHVLSSIRKNTSRVKEAHESTKAFYDIMKDSDPSEKKEMEDELMAKVHTLKVAQEALLKSIHRKREDIFAAQHDNEADFITAGSPVNLSNEDVELLVDTIKEEANLPVICDDDDSVPPGPK